jgi:hypothetical protein
MRRYGYARDGLGDGGADPEFQKVMADVPAVSQLAGRRWIQSFKR